MSIRICAVIMRLYPAPYGLCHERVSFRDETTWLEAAMARSLKTNYLLLALGVGTVLSLLLGGVSYYEHRVDTADINQLTHAAVEQKLEADLETRGESLRK